MAKNKVEFGLSNLHVGLYTVADDGTVTMGEGMAIPGAKSISVDADADENSGYYDNVKYWSRYSSVSLSGTIEVATLPDEFLTTFCGYEETADGGLAENKAAQRPAVWFAFQTEGDAQSRRAIFYNVMLAPVKQDRNTMEDSIDLDDPQIDFTVVGDNATGYTRAAYNPDAAGYETLLTAPAAPAKKADTTTTS